MPDNASATLPVAVIGAGIGGLTTAAALVNRGFDVQVYEQASELGEIGAGIQISPNASRVLYGLGLAGLLESSAVWPEAWRQRRWDDGRMLLRTPLLGDIEHRYGYPHLQLHRADVVSALRIVVPAESVHVGHRLDEFAQRGDHVEATFSNGHAAAFSALIGADGLHSTVRTTLFDTSPARDTGCMAYRALVPADRVRDLKIETTSDIFLGPRGCFVQYYVREGKLINLVALIERDAHDEADMLAFFDGWHPRIRALLRAADEVLVWPVFDRPTLDTWTAGRVALLGDSCHAMPPYLGQGAAQSIEDGAALAACLANIPAVSEALKHYEYVRRPRATRVQQLSRENVVRFHLPDGTEQRSRDAEMATGETDWSPSSIGWIYAQDASDVSEVHASE